MLACTVSDTSQVTVLLGLYNGARCIAPQLESILGQRGGPPSVHISDDGSTDGGLEIVREIAARYPGRVAINSGPAQGLAANFLQLLRSAGEAPPYVALSDQDDIWLPDKLARALEMLAAAPPQSPALYCARTWIWDPNTDRRRPSRGRPRAPSFRNALVQSYAGGNTMVLNRAGLDLVQAAAAEAGEIVMHDWWIYQIISGAGGQIVYDTEPTVLYRQHHGNQIGANDSLTAGLVRLRMVLKGRLRDWNDTNMKALERSVHRFTPENQKLLDCFANARKAPLPSRINAFRRIGVYRQTIKGQAGLWLAIMLGRL